MLECNRSIRVAAAVGVLALLSACSTGQRRPVLETSVVESSASTTSGSDSDLDFFDALESSRLVCQDDVLHSALLLGNGESAASYTDRVALARRLGYVGSGFDHPAHEAATLGEVAQIFLRVSDGTAAGDRVSQEQALKVMAGRGLMPAQARPYQGMTGAQLLTVMGGVRTAMGDRERPHLQVPGTGATPPAMAMTEPEAVPSASAAPLPPREPVTPSASGSSAVASADGAVSAAAEPLPASATDVALEPDAGSAPAPPEPASVEPPAATPILAPTAPTPPTPPTPPTIPAAPVKPKVWVPGKPLRKPGQ